MRPAIFALLIALMLASNSSAQCPGGRCPMPSRSTVKVAPRAKASVRPVRRLLPRLFFRFPNVG